MIKNILFLSSFILINIFCISSILAHENYLTRLADLSYSQAISQIKNDIAKNKFDKQSFCVWQLHIENGSLCNVCYLKPNNSKFELKTFVYDKTQPLKEIVINNYAVLGINGGYFNLNNGLSTSYVTDSNENIVDPIKNPDLINNQNLKPFLNQILQRSEIRCYVQGKKVLFDIAKASSHRKDIKRLIWSLQAGPQLLPELTTNQEAFVRKNTIDNKIVDSIGTTLNKARSAIGITKNNEIFLVTVCSSIQDAQSKGCDLATLAQIFKDLNCQKALNLDGGTSSSMVLIQNGECINLCLKNPPTRIKSGFIICPKAH